MQTLLSSYGDILPAALDAMKEYAPTFTKCIRLPSPDKVSQCEEVILTVKNNGYAYLLVWPYDPNQLDVVLDVLRVAVIMKKSLPMQPYVDDYVLKMFCPPLSYVNNEYLPEEFQVREDEYAPTHLPLLFVDFWLLNAKPMQVGPNVSLVTTFTKSNKLKQMKLQDTLIRSCFFRPSKFC